MDPLRQALALHIGLLAIDGIEARTQLTAATRDATDLRKQLADRDAEIAALKAPPLEGQVEAGG